MPSTKLALVVGSALALIIVVAGYLHSSYRNNRLDALVVECEKSELTLAAEEAKADPSNAWYKADPVVTHDHVVHLERSSASGDPLARTDGSTSP